MAAGPCSHLLAPILHSRKDVKLNALQGRGGVPSSAAWDPSWPTPLGCRDSMAPTRWDLLLGMQASLQREGVSLHLRALLDFCFSSARSWSHPPDLLLPLDHSDLCYGDGETEAGRCHDLPYVHEDQESRVHALPDLPAMQLVIRGVTASPRSPTSSWG